METVHEDEYHCQNTVDSSLAFSECLSCINLAFRFVICNCISGYKYNKYVPKNKSRTFRNITTLHSRRHLFMFWLYKQGNVNSALYLDPRYKIALLYSLLKVTELIFCIQNDFITPYIIVIK